ncbi:N-dimethylarginine dimethylaminohydrolase [Cellulosimicrobium cellulans]|uniref:dimethylargininase n=1 Tax=Cellulosimicrobium cellulans TaxID=1710 RepID=UPI001EDBEC9A|nr:dimethylargininase [Cellulosimicrobium cellulans]UKJ62364.1 N-dimethylarginine dimethylaminohydrolase [Cellulosimicrobium cellulans]
MRPGQPRHYLMCRPTYFTVSYEINPWMDRRTPVDTPLAVAQWERLRDTYRDLGHTVETIDPVPGLPDMVYAANGATVVDGLVYSARFTHPERGPEGPAYLKWFADHGYVTHLAEHVNEGEGDLLVAGDVVLAGTGFRTDRAAHAEAAALWGREVVTLELVDPRFYHLDTALTVLRGDAGAASGGRVPDGGAHPALTGPPPVDVVYYPPAFSPAAQEVLRERYPDALLATEEDAVVLGLNAVSDGTHVVHAPRAARLAAALRERGYETLAVDTSELLRGGGGAKCCTLEIREMVAGSAAASGSAS